MSRILAFDPAEILAGRVPPVDFHMHTHFTDGKSSVEECVKAAVAAGLRAIAFSEHVSCNRGWLEQWFSQFMSEVGQCRARYPEIQIFTGVEAKVLDYRGTLNVLPEQVAAVDFVMGVVHGYPKREGEKAQVKMAELPEPEMRAIEVDASLAILENEVVSVIGHVGAVYSKRFGMLPMDDFERVIRKAASRSVPFEISATYHRPIAKELLRLAARHQARVTLGSDAHVAGRVGEVVRLLGGGPAA